MGVYIFFWRIWGFLRVDNEVELLGLMETQFLVFQKGWLSKWTFLKQWIEGSFSSHLCQTLVVGSFRCIAVSLVWGDNSLFLINDYWYNVFFSYTIDHLYAFLKKVSLHFFFIFEWDYFFLLSFTGALYILNIPLCQMMFVRENSKCFLPFYGVFLF